MGLGQYDSIGEYCGPHTASSVFFIIIMSAGLIVRQILNMFNICRWQIIINSALESADSALELANSAESGVDMRKSARGYGPLVSVVTTHVFN